MFKIKILFEYNIVQNETIQTSTSFFRNPYLLRVLLRKIDKEKKYTVFFYAGSSGEEIYSLAIFNQLFFKRKLILTYSDYSEIMLKKAKEGCYKNVHKHYPVVGNDHISFFNISQNNLFTIKDKYRKMFNEYILCDYTRLDTQFIKQYTSDIVFCNWSLLYYPKNVQKKALQNLCLQAEKYLVIVGCHAGVLHSTLRENNFVPIHDDFALIYDGWEINRAKYDYGYKTYSSPFLTDFNKTREHYRRYSLFERLS